MADESEGRASQYPDTTRGWAARWGFEFEAAKKSQKDWWEKGEKIVRRYLDDRDYSDSRGPGSRHRLNLFNGDVNTKKNMMYGNTPTATVTRKFEDARDSVARVAAEMGERLINHDIERATDEYAAALEYGLSDYLLPGLAMARVRYVCVMEEPEVPEEASEEDAAVPTTDGGHEADDSESEQAAPVAKEALVDATGNVLAEAVPLEDKKSSEDVEINYVNWQDVLWSPSRTFNEWRWVAFKSQLTREALVERFGEDVGRAIPLNSKQAIRDYQVNAQVKDPWARADVWEIWNKETREVFWYVEGYAEILDRQDDPYELPGFWPCPRPMVANLTTSKFMPRPEFALAEDLYDEIDEVTERITRLESGIKVVGVYDKNSPEVKRLLDEAVQNQLLPSENWGTFSEKGGIKGSVDMLPIDMMVAALNELKGYRQELIELCRQVTGMADVVRGQQQENGTPGEAQVKARYASVRMRALQGEFARWATDLLRLKFELIAKFFDVETILERSNAQFTFDADVAPQAAQLLKDRHHAFRIEIKSEQLAQEDFEALKAERTEWLAAISGYIQAAAPLAQQMPAAMPALLEILQWTMAGMRGSAQIQGVMDQMITAASQAAQAAQGGPQQQAPQQPDPKLLANQQKAQADMAKIQATNQGEIQRMQAETQQLEQRKRTDATINIQEEAARQKIRNGGMPPIGGVPT